MPMKPRCHNSIPAAAKPRKPICGRIAATICNRDRRLSSSTIKPVVAADMRSRFCKTGRTSPGRRLQSLVCGCPRASREQQLMIESCIELVCWAHCAAEIFQFVPNRSESGSARSLKARCNSVCHRSRSARRVTRGTSMPVRREKPARTRRSHDGLQQTRLRTAPNSASAKAIDYSLKRWARVTLKPPIYPSTTIPLKTIPARLPWAKRTGCWQAPNAPGNMPPSFNLARHRQTQQP